MSQTPNSELQERLLAGLLDACLELPFPIELMRLASASDNHELIAMGLVGQSTTEADRHGLLPGLALVREGRSMIERVATSESILEPAWKAAHLEGDFLRLLGRPSEARDALEDALSIARNIAKPDLIARTLLDLGRTAQTSSQLVRSHSLYTAALQQQPSKAVASLALHSLGDLFLINDEPMLALQHHERARKDLQILPLHATAGPRWWYGQTLISLNRMSEARAEVDLAERLLAPYGEMANATVRIANVELLLAEGKPQEAEARAREAANRMDKKDAFIHYTWATGCLIVSLLSLQRIREALELLDSFTPAALYSAGRERHYRMVISAQQQLGLWKDAAKSSDQLLKLLANRQDARSVLLDIHGLGSKPKTHSSTDGVFEDKIKELTSLRLDRNEVIRIMAHDVRQPLAEIQSSIHQLANNYSSNMPTESSLQRATMGIRALRNVTSQLATNSELDAGRVAAQLQSVDIAALIAQSLDDHKDISATRDIVFRLDITDSLAGVADAGLLRQVLSMLLQSAIRFSPMGGLISIRANRTGKDQVEIMIHDDGPSFTDQDLDSLFERHPPPGSARSDRGDSCGLGLYVARRLMASMSGSISRPDDTLQDGETVRLSVLAVPPSHLTQDPRSLASSTPGISVG